MAAAHHKQAQQLARQLFQLSLVNGLVSTAQVTGVLAYLEKHPPAHPLLVLKTYRRYIITELARSNALVEHAGPVADDVLRAIAGALTQKYQRPITATARQDGRLIAGLRVRVGDDVYESSVAAQLANLSTV
jgi:F-type H+-transporting ATPase subunit delta